MKTQITYCSLILIDFNEEWIMGNRYLSMKSEMISLDTAAEFTAK